jgi:hypothetical protein
MSVDSFERVVVVSGVLGLFASLLLRGLSVILGFSSPVIMFRITFYYQCDRDSTVWLGVTLAMLGLIGF